MSRPGAECQEEENNCQGKEEETKTLSENYDHDKRIIFVKDGTSRVEAESSRVECELHFSNTLTQNTGCE